MATHSSSTSSQTSANSRPKTNSEPDQLPLDVVFGILSNERRRRTCRYLVAEPEGTTLGDLAEHVASVENDKTVVEITSQERKRVYVGLYQCHLPKMDQAGVIDFDEDRKFIEVGECFEQVTGFLPAQEGGERAGSADGWTTAVTDFTRTVGGWIWNTRAL